MLHEVSPDQARLLGMLFPHLDGLEFVGVRTGDAGLVVVARTAPEPVACRGCGTPSSRLHERYRRRLEDVSCAGRPVRVELEVRRLCCLNADCAVVTFAEQVEGVTQWRQRRTPGLRHVLERVGLALAGRAGARLAAVLGAVVSRCTMLRLIRALPDPEVGTVRVLGVDEFAKRRGQSYATILIDLDTHRPVDVLDGREAQPLADWLAAHPGVGVVCRDRGGGFAEGARLGAPDARQCADRWHLYNNLCVAVDKTIRANRADLREPIPAGDDGQDAPEASGTGTTAAAQNNADTQISEAPEEASRTGAEDLLPSAEASAQLHTVPVADRTRQRHAEIHALLAQGFNQTQICQITGLSEQTVKKFRRAATADELLGDPGKRYRLFERFVPYLRKRVIEDGCDNAALLCRELRDQGYRGSTRTIRRYLVPLRAGLDGPDLPPKPPSVRDVRRWITSDPDHLTDDDKDHLAAILDRSRPLAALDQHVTTFAKMLIHRTGERDLDDWLTAVDTETTDLPHLRSFAQGLRRDHTAVLNGLSLPYSSGAVEGENCKIKHLKRIMFGRANLDLLRTMILHN